MHESGPEAGDRVTARAEYTYPEEPVGLVWQGQERKVARVERQWREPGRKVFVVVDDLNERFHLAYNERSGEWQVEKCP